MDPQEKGFRPVLLAFSTVHHNALEKNFGSNHTFLCYWNHFFLDGVMERAFKIFTNALVVMGLVFLSFRPSITNRVESFLVKAGSNLSAAPLSSSVDFPVKFSQYRGSFENAEKKQGGHSTPLNGKWVDDVCWGPCSEVAVPSRATFRLSHLVHSKVLRI